MTELAATVPRTEDSTLLRRYLEVLASSGIERAFFSEQSQGSWAGSAAVCAFASHLTDLPLGVVADTDSRSPVLIAEELAVLSRIAPGTVNVLKGTALNPLRSAHHFLTDVETPIRPRPGMAMGPLLIWIESPEAGRWARSVSLDTIQELERFPDTDDHSRAWAGAPEQFDERALQSPLTLFVLDGVRDLAALQQMLGQWKSVLAGQEDWLNLASEPLRSD